MEMLARQAPHPTAGDIPASPGRYDAFISYSHAADGLLAPRLHTGLHRFAKPWWKRRAMRVFRDEASLAANPRLWPSIAEALDDSAWFVLLLSPEAARSAWVNREIDYWLQHKDPERIIPVVTDGTFAWSGSDFDHDSSAVPPALMGAFAVEPRWVDLRFARTSEQLDLKNPRFSLAIADIASAIRAVPKDELETEEVRQHRRTIRTAWSAAVALVLLAVVAGGAATFAIEKHFEARAAMAEVAPQQDLVEAAEGRVSALEDIIFTMEELRSLDAAELQSLAAGFFDINVDRQRELAVSEGITTEERLIDAILEAQQPDFEMRIEKGCLDCFID